MNIQWYPGHMAKAKRQLNESLKLVDVVVELVDARAPLSTRNPDFEKLFGQKRRLLVLNKADAADPKMTQAFIDSFKAQGEEAMAFSFTSAKSVKVAVSKVSDAARDLVERYKARGMNKVVRAMVVGIPNVGKSTFINRLRGGSPARASDRPGVTRGTQWIVVNNYLEFLDTPGMLWPKLEDPQAAIKLAFLGSVRDQIMDGEELSMHLLDYLKEHYPGQTAQRFKLKDLDVSGYELLEAACLGRGWLMSGGRPDTDRGSAIILDEFRGGKLGPVTLDVPAGQEAQDAGDSQ